MNIKKKGRGSHPPWGRLSGLGTPGVRVCTCALPDRGIEHLWDTLLIGMSGADCAWFATALGLERFFPDFPLEGGESAGAGEGGA